MNFCRIGSFSHIHSLLVLCFLLIIEDLQQMLKKSFCVSSCVLLYAGCYAISPCCTVRMQIIFHSLKLPVQMKLWVCASQQLFICLSNHLSKVPFSNHLHQVVLQKVCTSYWILKCVFSFVLTSTSNLRSVHLKAPHLFYQSIQSAQNGAKNSQTSVM